MKSTKRRASSIASRISSLGFFVKDVDAPFSDFPVLSHAVKAAEARWLSRVGLRLAREYDDGNPPARMRVMLFKSLVKIYDLMDSSGMFLSSEGCTSIQKWTDDLLECYQALSSKAFEDRKLKWSIVNKHHMVWHLVRQVPLNPRFVWCFQGEDYQRFVTQVGHACAVGSSINAVSRRISERMRMGRHMYDFRQIRSSDGP